MKQRAQESVAGGSPPPGAHGSAVRVLIVIALVSFMALVGLGAFRALADQRVEQLWAALTANPGSEVFDPAMVDDLPEPAQRYLLHAIAPGAPLAQSVVLHMHGSIALDPGIERQAMRAQELLTARGLIWRAWVGEGVMRFSGHDYFALGEGAMRWFLWGMVPVVQARGPDLARSAAGRVALEVPLWLPSALLPQAGARWEAVDERRARVHLKVGSEELAPTLTVAADGQLERIEMPRWDVRGLDGQPGYVPWLGEVLGEEKTFGGYTIGVRVRATAKAGTAQANPFFEAVVTAAEYR